MAPVTPVIKLTLAPYLASWQPDRRVLQVNLLVMPDGDPRLPLGPGLPAPIDAKLIVAPRLFADPASLPGRAAAAVALDPIALDPAPDRHKVIDAVDRTFQPPAAPAAPPTAPPSAGFRKHLPDSYRAAFAFGGPRDPRATLGDEYRHALRCRAATPAGPSTTTIRSFSEALAYLMRQPAVLRAAGLLYTLDVPVPADVHAGWLGFELDGKSDYADAARDPANARWFGRYLTRVPVLPDDRKRPLFTAVLFPLVEDPATLGAIDAAFDEATRFDDGFAKIVHAGQPTREELHQLDDGGKAPSTDRGVRVAWDDEDVLAGLNRLVAPGPTVPRGVAGYRLDVRAGADWRSLSAVTAKALRLDGWQQADFAGELRLAVTPQRIATGEDWLLPYFATWTGGPMVVRDPVDRYLRGAAPSPDGGDDMYAPVPTGVELRYGASYELRVRLADAVGGGPAVDAEPEHAGEAPIATVAFRRFVPIGRVIASRVSTTQLTVVRPALGYPAIAYAAGRSVLGTLVAQRQAGGAAELHDPDATELEIRVLVRGPVFDPIGDAAGYRALYTTTRPFPADPGAALELALAPLDSDDVDHPAFAGAATGPLAVPTARDVRLELRAISGRADYFGGDAARGKPTQLDLAPLAPAVAAPLFRALDPAAALRAVFSRADAADPAATRAVIPAQVQATSATVERLAAGLGLRTSGDTLLGAPGRRVIFGCTGAAHRTAPDGSSLTLLARAELVGAWACAVRVELDRDWSWRGLAAAGVQLERTIRRAGVPDAVTPLGAIPLIHTAGPSAVEAEPDRSHTAVVLVDVFAPGDGELEVHYAVTAAYDPAPATGDAPATQLAIRLPVVTPPREAPRVVSVGHAQSPFHADADYGATAPRRRALWLELDRPLAEPHLGLFARVLAHAPDPMLLTESEPAADPPPYPDLPIDPELARVIVPDQPDDHAGAGAMQRLTPATAGGVHYLVPLPPGSHEGSPELLGFYTYELRLGRLDGEVWTTARGRFGPPLVLEGVQHPAPELPCTAARAGGQLVAAAEHAVAFFQDAAVPAEPPRTELWFALYAQAPQADGSGARNLLLDVRRGAGDTVAWDEPTLAALLGNLGLSPAAPLSVLAVELLPEPIARYPHPLGAELGRVRVLRSSPLSRVNAAAC